MPHAQFDHGWGETSQQYARHDHRAVHGAEGIVCSMSRGVDGCAHTLVQNFSGTLKAELTVVTWTRAAAATLTDPIDVFYTCRNRTFVRRSHQSSRVRTAAGVVTRRWCLRNRGMVTRMLRASQCHTNGLGGSHARLALSFGSRRRKYGGGTSPGRVGRLGVNWALTVAIPYPYPR